MNFFSNQRQRSAFCLLEVLIIIMLIGLFEFCAMTAMAQPGTQPYQPNFYKTYSFTTANTNQTLTPNFTDTIRANSGEGFFLSVVATNATSANVTVKLDLTVDGTNYTSNPQFQFAVALNGTNIVTLYTNLDRAYISGARAVRISSLANGHTNSISGFAELSHSNQ